MDKSSHSPDLLKAILKLKPEDHLGLIYQNHIAQFSDVIPCIMLGLECHEGGNI